MIVLFDRERGTKVTWRINGIGTVWQKIINSKKKRKIFISMIELRNAKVLLSNDKLIFTRIEGKREYQIRTYMTTLQI